MFHWNTCSPTGSPVTVVAGSLGSVMAPKPLTWNQKPSAGNAAALPESVTSLAGVQISMSPPASAAACWSSYTKMLTRSVVMPLAQGPLLTVHRKMFSPVPRPITRLVGLAGLVMVPLPLTSVHVPVAGLITLLPCSEVLVAGRHSCWSLPAFATGFRALKTRMVTSSEVVEHWPLTMVQA